jgi:hypothetical protein
MDTMKHQLPCSVLALFVALIIPLAAAAQEGSSVPHDYRICPGDFALCAASICTPDGNKIRVNVNGTGKTRLFDEAVCTCPIFPGPGLGDVIAGNMRGSCSPPKSKDALWSLYSPMAHIPQAINAWLRTNKASAAPGFQCPKSKSLTFTNCFSFACKRSGSIRGVALATCKCPLGEFDGGPVAPGTSFATQAGQCSYKACYLNPVGAVFSFDDIVPGECIDFDGAGL